MIRRIKNVSILTFLLAALAGSSLQAEDCGGFYSFCTEFPYGPGLGFDCSASVSCAYVSACEWEIHECTVEYCNATGSSQGGPWGAAYCG